jgi:bacterioferritin-associated ferredoxin
VYICICNAIRERDVRKVLEQDNTGASTVSGVYHACSGGEKPQCCSCIQTLKDIVTDHKKKCCGGMACGKAEAA